MELTAKRSDTNLNQMERLVSVIGGSGLVAYGLAKRNSSGYALASARRGPVMARCQRALQHVPGVGYQYRRTRL